MYAGRRVGGSADLGGQVGEYCSAPISAAVTHGPPTELTPVLVGLLAKDPADRMGGEEAARRLAPSSY